VQELVGLQPDIIYLASTTPATVDQRETRTGVSKRAVDLDHDVAALLLVHAVGKLDERRLHVLALVLGDQAGKNLPKLRMLSTRMDVLPAVSLRNAASIASASASSTRAGWTAGAGIEDHLGSGDSKSCTGQCGGRAADDIQ
jgi:hypothetical protein